MRMMKTLTTPAETTAAKGTRRVRMVRVMGFRFFKRGTRAFKLRATEPATVVASKKDVLSSLLVKGVDLLALAELMAT